MAPVPAEMEPAAGAKWNQGAGDLEPERAADIRGEDEKEKGDYNSMGKLQEELERKKYNHIYRYHPRKGTIFDIYQAPKELQLYPWCISYRGNGYYFLTLRECLVYAYGRYILKARPEVEQQERIITKLLESK